MRGVPGFSGQRLRQAREALGLTIVSLAGVLGVSRQVLSMYEGGERSPAPDLLDRLAVQLGMPREFFFHEPPERDGAPVFYRSLSAATKTVREMAERREGWLEETTACLEQLVELPPADVPVVDVDHPLKLTADMIDQAAYNTRMHWGLPDGPVADVIGTAERHGIVVSKFAMQSDTLDAFSRWPKGGPRPFVVLNSDKGSAVRLRLDTAHEIGHQVLHRHVDPTILRTPQFLRLAEDQAFRFAGAFLMPSDSFLDQVDAASLDYLRVIKPVWGASIGAMVFRLLHLGVIDEVEAQRLWRSYGMRGWRKVEPFDDDMKPEQPQLLASAVAAIGGPHALPSILRGRIALPEKLHEELLGLPSGSMATRPTPAVALRPDAVLPFRRES